MPRLTLSQIVFALFTGSGLALLGVAGPGGHVLVSTPDVEKVTHDPSVRLGSSHVHHWFTTGGGYHGGK
jgi:hypothetical protein